MTLPEGWVCSFSVPWFMSASEAIDVGRMTDVSGHHLRAGLTDTISGGNAVTRVVLV